MDTLHVVLLIAALVAGAAAIALLIARGRGAADTAVARASLAAADARAARAEAELAEARRLLADETARREKLHADLSERNHALELRAAQLDQELEARLAGHREELIKAQEIYRAQLTALEQRERDLETKLAEYRKDAADTFRALASDALKHSSTSFLELAKQSFAAEQARAKGELDQSRLGVQQLVAPIGETLKKTEAKLAEIERQRLESFATLSSQIRTVADAAGLLGQRTEKLREALSKPQVRGRYGEIQLQRVVEVAGMKSYCDFNTQESVRDTDGRAQRPDMTVKLPNDRVIVIDAKANIGAYVEAMEADSPEASEACLQRFAGHVADQVGKLAAKVYWDQFDKTPEFVIMFVPGDQFIDAALQRRPELFELAAQKRVILASPSTLIGLLRAVELGWKEQRLAEEAVELRQLGIDLHERACIAFRHLGDLGRAIESTARKYNDFVGSYETRLEPALRRFQDAGVKSAKELPEVDGVEVRIRMLPGAAEPQAS
ncbi:MAG: DNA recombination protein RmuC [Phycisphaerales bacterium]|nr:DNA recombination protein RmuC [Phycisphaerales bacterium]